MATRDNLMRNFLNTCQLVMTEAPRSVVNCSTENGVGPNGYACEVHRVHVPVLANHRTQLCIYASLWTSPTPNCNAILISSVVKMAIHSDAQTLTALSALIL